MTRSMVESEKLYDEIKHFFFKKEMPNIVIEISDLPMDQWIVVVVDSPEMMCEARRKLVHKNIGLAGFQNFEWGYSFYFGDENFFKSVMIPSGEVIDFFDFTFKTYSEAKLIEELKQIQGS